MSFSYGEANNNNDNSVILDSDFTQLLQNQPQKINNNDLQDLLLEGLPPVLESDRTAKFQFPLSFTDDDASESGFSNASNSTIIFDDGRSNGVGDDDMDYELQQLAIKEAMIQKELQDDAFKKRSSATKIYCSDNNVNKSFVDTPTKFSTATTSTESTVNYFSFDDDDDDDDANFDPAAISPPPKYTLSMHASALQLQLGLGNTHVVDQTKIWTQQDVIFRPNIILDYCQPLPHDKLSKLHYVGLESPSPEEEHMMPVRMITMHIRPDVLCGTVMDIVHSACQAMNGTMHLHVQYKSQVLKRQGGHFRGIVAGITLQTTKDNDNSNHADLNSSNHVKIQPKYVLSHTNSYVIDAQLATKRSQTLDRHLVLRFFPLHYAIVQELQDVQEIIEMTQPDPNANHDDIIKLQQSQSSIRESLMNANSLMPLKQLQEACALIQYFKTDPSILHQQQQEQLRLQQLRQQHQHSSTTPKPTSLAFTFTSTNPFFTTAKTTSSSTTSTGSPPFNTFKTSNSNNLNITNNNNKSHPFIINNNNKSCTTCSIACPFSSREEMSHRLQSTFANSKSVNRVNSKLVAYYQNSNNNNINTVINSSMMPNTKRQSKRLTTEQEQTFPALSIRHDWQILQSTQLLCTEIWNLLSSTCTYDTLASLKFGHSPNWPTIDVQYGFQLWTISRDIMHLEWNSAISDLQRLSQQAWSTHQTVCNSVRSLYTLYDLDLSRIQAHPPPNIQNMDDGNADSDDDDENGTLYVPHHVRKPPLGTYAMEALDTISLANENSGSENNNDNSNNNNNNKNTANDDDGNDDRNGENQQSVGFNMNEISFLTNSFDSNDNSVDSFHMAADAVRLLYTACTKQQDEELVLKLEKSKQAIMIRLANYHQIQQDILEAMVLADTIPAQQMARQVHSLAQNASNTMQNGYPVTKNWNVAEIPLVQIKCANGIMLTILQSMLVFVEPRRRLTNFLSSFNRSGSSGPSSTASSLASNAPSSSSSSSSRPNVSVYSIHDVELTSGTQRTLSIIAGNKKVYSFRPISMDAQQLEQLIKVIRTIPA